MAAFFDQLAESADWQQGTPHFVDAPANPTAAQRSADAAAPAASKPVNSLARSRRGALLSRVVEIEILPRLAIARGAAVKKSSAQADPFLTTEADTAELVRLLLVREAASAIAFVDVLQLRGATPAALYLGLLSKAARRLGELWEDDRADFTQVTISLGRLQQVVRALAPSFQESAVTRAHPETVLLLAAPGGQHTFGLVILSEFFCREGWHVMGGPMPYGNDDLTAFVRDSWVDIVGFSIGSTSQLDSLTRSIRLARSVSRNRGVGIMVGGPLLLVRPELVARVGADMTAMDAESAVRQASGLMAMRAAVD